MAPVDWTFDKSARTVPPQAWFGVSAIFHYLGPSFAVLLFPAVGVLGVAWFALLLALLPATATIIGVIVLAQIPTLKDVFGVLLVMTGVAIHRPPGTASMAVRSGELQACPIAPTSAIAKPRRGLAA